MLKRQLKRQLAVLAITGGIAVIAAGCSDRAGTAADAASAVEARTFSVKLAPTSMRLDFLTAELSELNVVERVDNDSGEIVAPATLRGMLKVKNTSSDQTARLVGGSIEYIGASGDRIAVAPGRGGTGFTFYSYSGERVDPGKDTSQTIDVPFPASALNGAGLAEVRLRLTYIPTPYRTDAATAAASLTAQDR